jgi:hypothetical protein
VDANSFIFLKFLFFLYMTISVHMVDANSLIIFFIFFYFYIGLLASTSVDANSLNFFFYFYKGLLASTRCGR